MKHNTTLPNFTPFNSVKKQFYVDPSIFHCMNTYSAIFAFYITCQLALLSSCNSQPKPPAAAPEQTTTSISATYEPSLQLLMDTLYLDNTALPRPLTANALRPKMGDATRTIEPSEAEKETSLVQLNHEANRVLLYDNYGLSFYQSPENNYYNTLIINFSYKGKDATEQLFKGKFLIDEQPITATTPDSILMTIPDFELDSFNETISRATYRSTQMLFVYNGKEQNRQIAAVIIELKKNAAVARNTRAKSWTNDELETLRQLIKRNPTVLQHQAKYGFNMENFLDCCTLRISNALSMDELRQNPTHAQPIIADMVERCTKFIVLKEQQGK